MGGRGKHACFRLQRGTYLCNCAIQQTQYFPLFALEAMLVEFKMDGHLKRKVFVGLDGKQTRLLFSAVSKVRSRELNA